MIEDVEEIISILARRKTIRDFSDKEVDHSLIDNIINDSLEAPSACNHQMWHFVIVKDGEKKQALQKISGSNKHFSTCSAIILLCFHKGWNHNKFAVVQSVAAAVHHMSLSAHVRGLGSVWSAGIGNSLKIGKLFKIPSYFEIIGALCLGYPREGSVDFVKPPRRPLSSIRSWEKFIRPKDELYPLKKSLKYPYFDLKNNKNKYSLHSPKKWGWGKIANFRSYAVYAKSPLPGVYISRRFGAEMDKEVSFLPNLESGRVLEIMPYGGSYTYKILNKFKNNNVEIHTADLHKYNIEFTKERIRSENCSDEKLFTSIIKDGKLNYDDNYFDAVFAPQILEAIPDRNILLGEINRVLKKDGSAVFSTRNLLSWFGLYFYKFIRKYQVANFGPFVPISSFKIKNEIKKKFNILDEFGMSFVPKFTGTKKKGVWGKFSRLYIILVKKK